MQTAQTKHWKLGDVVYDENSPDIGNYKGSSIVKKQGEQL